MSNLLKLFIGLLFLFQSIFSYSMNDNLNLEKYSYHLIGVEWNQNTVINATGFFIKKNNRLFLITASHAITGWNGLQQINDSNHPDEMEIIFQRIGSDEIEPFNIDLRPFKSRSKKINVEIEPDITIIELDIALTEKFTIHSIEDLMMTKELNVIDSMKIFGYTNSHPPKTHLIDIINDHCKEGSIKYLTTSKLKESINYEAQTLNGSVTQGSSGAPVFTISTKDHSIKFNGICIAGEPGNNKYPQLLILKPEVIVNSIQRLLIAEPNINKGIPSTLKNWIILNGLE